MIFSKGAASAMMVAVLFLAAAVNPAAIIQTVAGNGTSAFSDDNGAAATASLSDPFGVAVDAIGNLYIADTSNHPIRKVDTSGIIATVAGNGIEGHSELARRWLSMRRGISTSQTASITAYAN